MNEIAMICDRLGIDTDEVLAGMNTKWNALGFRPGLVGGHCIGVDPYYFTYEAEVLGYHSQIILAGRKVNDSMGTFVAESAIREMVLAGMTPKSARTIILGFTFKENCPDLRNSKVKDIYDRLRDYGRYSLSGTVTLNGVASEVGFRLSFRTSDGLLVSFYRDDANVFLTGSIPSNQPGITPAQALEALRGALSVDLNWA